MDLYLFTFIPSFFRIIFKYSSSLSSTPYLHHVPRIAIMKIYIPAASIVSKTCPSSSYTPSCILKRGSLESSTHGRSFVGFDLHLNRLDETPEAGSFSMGKMDIPLPRKQPSMFSGLSNGGSVSRDFDSNNGPGLDEVSTEVPACTLQMKSTIPFSSSVHGTRTNKAEFGNYSSWFPPGNP